MTCGARRYTHQIVKKEEVFTPVGNGTQFPSVVDPPGGGGLWWVPNGLMLCKKLSVSYKYVYSLHYHVYIYNFYFFRCKHGFRPFKNNNNKQQHTTVHFWGSVLRCVILSA